MQSFPDIHHRTQRKGGPWRRIHTIVIVIAASAFLAIVFGKGLIPENVDMRDLFLRKSQFRCPDDMTCTARASSISALDLMNDRFVQKQSDNGGVPRIIHQCWFGSKSLTTLGSTLSNTWRTNHPKWTYVLWNEKDNRMLVERYYPWFLAAYDSLDLEIKRADAVRNLYMHRFGGLYVDFDVESFRPIDALLNEATAKTRHDDLALISQAGVGSTRKDAYFGSMGTRSDFAHSIPNDWMASSAGHSFFLLPILSIVSQGVKSSNADGPEAITGPVALRNAVLKFKELYPTSRDRLFARANNLGFPVQKDNLHLRVFNETTIHPFDWDTKDPQQTLYCFAHRATFDIIKCKEQLRPLQNDAYAVSYWSHAWE